MSVCAASSHRLLLPNEIVIVEDGPLTMSCIRLWIIGKKATNH